MASGSLSSPGRVASTCEAGPQRASMPTMSLPQAGSAKPATGFKPLSNSLRPPVHRRQQPEGFTALFHAGGAIERGHRVRRTVLRHHAAIEIVAGCGEVGQQQPRGFPIPAPKAPRWRGIPWRAPVRLSRCTSCREGTLENSLPWRAGGHANRAATASPETGAGSARRPWSIRLGIKRHLGSRQHQHSARRESHVQNLLVLFPNQLPIERDAGRTLPRALFPPRPGGNPHLPLFAPADFFHQQILFGIFGQRYANFQGSALARFFPAGLPQCGFKCGPRLPRFGRPKRGTLRQATASVAPPAANPMVFAASSRAADPGSSAARARGGQNTRNTAHAAYHPFTAAIIAHRGSGSRSECGLRHAGSSAPPETISEK